VVNSRELDTLHPIVAAKAARYLSRAKDEGIELVILSTYRDFEMQQALWFLGRTRLGPRWTGEQPLGQPYTHNPPGLSWHNYGMAFDALPLVGCRLVTIADACDMPVWRALRAISREPKINLRMWLELPNVRGRVREYAHHQYTGGLTIEEVERGERLPDIDV
jgi:peptidoglycan L-alanyl-D-glutamate endopeptidase CwlK